MSALGILGLEICVFVTSEILRKKHPVYESSAVFALPLHRRGSSPITIPELKLLGESALPKPYKPERLMAQLQEDLAAPPPRIMGLAVSSWKPLGWSVNPVDFFESNPKQRLPADSGMYRLTVRASDPNETLFFARESLVDVMETDGQQLERERAQRMQSLEHRAASFRRDGRYNEADQLDRIIIGMQSGCPLLGNLVIWDAPGPAREIVLFRHPTLHWTILLAAALFGVVATLMRSSEKHSTVSVV